MHGISIVADAPECNNAMLNVKRPGVLRQYYGKDIGSKDSVSVERVAYRSNVSIRSEGSDPYKLIIKPFPQAMEDMASYIYNLIVENKSELDLHDVDISNDFNSCTVLLYHALTGYKPASSMGWHCDNKFSINGNFSQISNGQLYNTPVVIFTIGMSRVLNWRRRITRMKDNGFRSWEVENKACESMLLEEGHICIINPLDEKPHYNEDVKETIHFQHGNVKVSGNNISVGFVFRVSPHRCICST